MNLYMNWLSAAADTATTGATEGGEQVSGLMATLVQFGPIVLVLLLMYFLMIRPQQKKQKEEQKMRNNLRVGDELTTIGGIKGRVVAIKDDTITLETGNDRTKMQFEMWAIQTVHTKHEDTIDDDDDDDDDDI